MEAAGFALFSKLPSEIRLFIWKTALTVPQTFIISEANCTHDTRSGSRYACSESYAVALTLRQHSFRHFMRHDRSPFNHGNFASLHIDTFWLNQIVDSFLLYSSLEWKCGSCAAEITHQSREECQNHKGCLRPAQSPYTEGCLRRLVIHFSFWDEADEKDSGHPGTIGFFQVLRCEELYLVVGDLYHASEDDGVRFVETENQPLFQFWKDHLLDDPNGMVSGAQTWRELASNLEEYMHDFKLRRTMKRQEFLNATGIEGDDRLPHLRDLSNLHVPRITFVEVVSPGDLQHYDKRLILQT